MASCEVRAAPKLGFGSSTQEQLMQTYRPPAFSPPYPVLINPEFHLCIEKVVQWMQRLKVDTILSPKIYQRLLSMDILGLVARIYTDPAVCGVEWICKYYYLFWIWDDALDSNVISQSPEKAFSSLLEVHLMMMWSFPDDPVLRTQVEPFLNHLEGQAREEKVSYIESMLAEARTKPGTVYSKPTSSILCDAYQDLWEELVASASPELCLRFAYSNYTWFVQQLKETETRKLNEPLSIDNYMQIRRGSIGLASCLVLVDFIYGLHTPDSWFYCPEMASIFEAIADIVGSENDVRSFKREVLVEKEKYFNLVLLISVDRNISYTEAAEIIVQMMYDRISDFEKAAKRLESVTPPEYRRTYELYMLSYRNWVSGAHDWQLKSLRYLDNLQA